MILVADRLHIVTVGFAAILSNIYAEETVIPATGEKEFLDAINKNKIDDAIVDYGIIFDCMAQNELRLLLSGMRTLVTNEDASALDIQRTMQLGARGHISKFAARDEFVEAIKLIRSGFKYICTESIEQLVVEPSTENNDPHSSPLDILTNKEIVIARKISQGKTSKEIGLTLGISHTTVDKHRNNILKKLRINNSKYLRKYFGH